MQDLSPIKQRSWNIQKDDFLISKEEVLGGICAQIQKMKAELKAQEQAGNIVYRKQQERILQLWMDLWYEVDRKAFPELGEGWQFGIVMDLEGIKLYAYNDFYRVYNSKHYDMTFPVITLYTLKAESYSVEAFANLMEVTPLVVRQWLRRGKLIGAKKYGTLWRIPLLVVPPQRKYLKRRYYIDASVRDKQIFEDRLELLNGYGCFSIEKGMEKEYLVKLSKRNLEYGVERIIDMTTSEREKFEMAVMEHPFITVEIDFTYVDYKNSDMQKYIDLEKQCMLPVKYEV